MKKILSLAILSLGIAGASAQNFNSSYFLDGVSTRHEMNPAFDTDYNYVSMPALGNLGVGVQGNVALTDFIKKGPDGSLMTFLHPSMQNMPMDLPANCRTTMDMRLQVLGAGFHAWGGYNTIGISVRATGGEYTPGRLFSFLREMTACDYTIGDIGARVQAYSEIALGHSHKIGDNLRVGGKVKVLIGGAYADATLPNVTANLNGNEHKWSLKYDGKLNLALTGLRFKMIDLEDDQASLDEMELHGPGLNGGGLAFDLGAEYAFKGAAEGLKLSASLLDLGFVRWKNALQAEDLDKTVVIDDITDWEALEQLYHVTEVGTQSVTTGLGATLNIGAEYALPMYNRLKFGLLSTTRIHGKYSWNEERLSANIRPLDWVELGVSGGVGSFGGSFGWIVNFKPRGFNFYLGMDRTFGKFAKQMAPLSSKGDIYMGMNFTFGGRK